MVEPDLNSGALVPHSMFLTTSLAWGLRLEEIPLVPKAPAPSLMDKGPWSPHVQQHGQLACPGTGK